MRSPAVRLHLADLTPGRTPHTARPSPTNRHDAAMIIELVGIVAKEFYQQLGTALSVARAECLYQKT
jgi:hypothetical protein